VRADDPTDWEPRSKPIWFTEYGCAAVDKGANQPNVFLDPKSSESASPYYSNGQRDDLMQMQYLLAQHAFWADPANNPTSDIYGGAMVDWSKSHAWAWDARPWPWFPGNTDLWSDGENWLRGHWLTGRATNQPLSAVIAEVCQRADIADFDVSAVYGVVRGYVTASTATGRAALQPLMMAHGVEAVERDGQLIFRMRDGCDPVALDSGDLVAQDGGDLSVTRGSEVEKAGRLRLAYIEAEGQFETRSAEAVIPDEVSGDVANSELPMGLTHGEARTAVKRWLSEARVARDIARFSLPASSTLGAGDIVTLDHDGVRRSYRIDRLDMAGARSIEAVRIEPGIYRHADRDDSLTQSAAYQAAVPVLPLFLDLPLMRGDEVPHAPHLAVTGRPWPGSVAAYDAPAGGGAFALNVVKGVRSTIGLTRTPLFKAHHGLWQRGAGVEVTFAQSATLASAAQSELLDGSNLAVIGNGAVWEVFQFTSAELLDPGVWRLSGLLRGQFGTDALMPDAWAPDSIVVLMDDAVSQVELAETMRDVARRWRIGPAALAYDDPTYVESTEVFAGNGLRPYSPAHLRAARQTVGADLSVTWVRRTRSGGDSWAGFEVPLSEENEQYLVRIIHNGTVVREVQTATPSYVYPVVDQTNDGVFGAFSVSVAQLSAAFGPGLFAATQVPG